MRVFLDGASLQEMGRLAGRWEGVTTNPSLMKQAGIRNYRDFAREVLRIAAGWPVSFEVLAVDHEEMVKQGREIASWGDNVHVKIPILTPDGAWTAEVIAALSSSGVRINVTAVMTEEQVLVAHESLHGVGHIVSIFAGRVADTGVDPEPLVKDAAMLVRRKADVLWASVREVFNVKQAERSGADIITLTPGVIEKMNGFGRDLHEYSIETARQFQRDSEEITL